jgi:hypothetical protein
MTRFKYLKVGLAFAVSASSARYFLQSFNAQGVQGAGVKVTEYMTTSYGGISIQSQVNHMQMENSIEFRVITITNHRPRYGLLKSIITVVLEDLAFHF